MMSIEESKKKFMGKLEDTLRSEMEQERMAREGKKEEAKEPVKESPLFTHEDVEDTTGRKKFSEVFGFTPPSGVEYLMVTFSCTLKPCG